MRASLWALPLLMVLIACGLAYGALNTTLELDSGSAWYLYSGGAKDAPQFLSNLVSSMITMATLAISITMVVLTLAAQQLGPRLIRNFMGDRRTQAVLGLFVSTVVYLLLVLRSSYGLTGNAVPNLAVTVGTGLVLASVATLLFFVHHLARSIIADNVVTRIGEQLDRDIARLLPADERKSGVPATRPENGAPVRLQRGGYVQAIDYTAIVASAAAANAVVAIDIRAGQHVVPGRTFASISPVEAAGDKLCSVLRAAVLIGNERTAVQDLEFSIHQLVEIALRALSSGISDPYTAIAVLDRLTLAMMEVMARATANHVWRDEKQTVRVIGCVSTFEGIADAAFNQIRQRAAQVPSVLIRMTECLSQLREQASGAQRPVLDKQLRLVIEAGRRNIPDADDLKDLESRAAAGRRPAAGL